MYGHKVIGKFKTNNTYDIIYDYGIECVPTSDWVKY